VKVVGLYLVRNEVDIIETNLRHHLTTVLDEAIVVDNGSTDGTFELLAELADELPLQLGSEIGHVYQSARVTRMARYAAQQGADWVLPIDADEFWVARDEPFRSVLEEAPVDARALFVDVINFVQRRDVLAASPGVVATMTMRPDDVMGTAEEASRLVLTGAVSWVELPYAPKAVHRALPDVFVGAGNHLSGISGGIPTDALTCLHAPLRARSLLVQKIDHGRRSIEEQSSAESAWHLKRWWQMAREGTLDREWEALSYEDGAITVGGDRHELVRDDRLKDVVEAVAPQVRATDAGATNATDDLEPAIAAYLLALDEVPGWFSSLDARILVELDRLQRGQGLRGDLFEIGTSFGKSAILLGYLARPEERLTVCDVFEHKQALDPESLMIINHWYADVSEKGFLEEYERFHEQPPDVIVGPSGEIDAEERAGTCRIVHVDGGHRYDVARQDVATARTLLGPGGLAAFGNISTPHNPGVALAVWELVLDGEFVPLCLTESKLYGTWDHDAVPWLTAGIDQWVDGRPDLGKDIHTLAGWAVRRIYAHDRPRVNAELLVRIPDLDAMPGPEDEEPPAP
jgi:hypothetical protein